MGLENFLQEIPIIGGLFDDSNSDAMRQYERAAQYWSQIDPNSSQYKQTYNPYAPKEAQYNLLEEDPALLGKQQEYLSKLAGLSEDGLSPVDALNLEDMSRASSAAMQSGAATAARNARSRGVSGGGLEFALGQQAGQAGVQDARQAGFQKAAQEANQRALYTKAYGDALGGVRDDNARTGTYNSGVINAFNKYNTGVMNEAQKYNNEEQNQVKQGNFNNAATVAKGAGGAANELGNVYSQQGAANSAQRGKNLNTIGAGLDFFGVDPTEWFKKDKTMPAKEDDWGSMGGSNFGGWQA